jgi:hypothetical protein
VAKVNNKTHKKGLKKKKKKKQKPQRGKKGMHATSIDFYPNFRYERL